MPIGSIERALELVGTGSSDSTLTYYFAPSMPSYAVGKTVTGFSTTQGGPNYVFKKAHFVNVGSPSNVALAVQSMDGMSAVSSISFTAQSSVNADIVVFGINQELYSLTSTNPIGAFAYPPTWPDAKLRYDVVLTPTGQSPSLFEFVFAHEVMHSVGIRDANAVFEVTDEDNSARYTIMSYATHPGYPDPRYATELQLYDIAALQALYGRDDSFQPSNTIINQFADNGLDRMFSIWDGGGNDTIDASSLTKAALIDLRPGNFSSVGPESNFRVTAGVPPTVEDEGRLNTSIAYGAYIENAKGTVEGDLIIGNLLSNRLEGGAGNDVIFGEGADSIHDPGDGEYRRITTTGSHLENAPAAVKAFVDDATKQQDHLLGGTGDDYLRGGRGNDLIEGGADNDYITGGGGSDEIWGGDRNSDQGRADGVDAVSYEAATAALTITLSGSANATLSIADGAGVTDSLRSIERIEGSAYDDRLMVQTLTPQVGNAFDWIDLG